MKNNNKNITDVHRVSREWEFEKYQKTFAHDIVNQFLSLAIIIKKIKKTTGTSFRLRGAGGEFAWTTGTANGRTGVNRREKKVRPISLDHIWRLRIETRRLATETGRRMGVVRRFIYNQRHAVRQPTRQSQCRQHRDPLPVPVIRIVITRFSRPCTVAVRIIAHVFAS